MYLTLRFIFGPRVLVKECEGIFMPKLELN